MFCSSSFDRAIPSRTLPDTFSGSVIHQRIRPIRSSRPFDFAQGDRSMWPSRGIRTVSAIAVFVFLPTLILCSQIEQIEVRTTRVLAAPPENWTEPLHYSGKQDLINAIYFSDKARFDQILEQLFYKIKQTIISFLTSEFKVTERKGGSVKALQDESMQPLFDQISDKQTMQVLVEYIDNAYILCAHRAHRTQNANDVESEPLTVSQKGVNLLATSLMFDPVQRNKLACALRSLVMRYSPLFNESLSLAKKRSAPWRTVQNLHIIGLPAFLLIYSGLVIYLFLEVYGKQFLDQHFQLFALPAYVGIVFFISLFIAKKVATGGYFGRFGYNSLIITESLNEFIYWFEELNKRMYEPATAEVSLQTDKEPRPDSSRSGKYFRGCFG